MSNATVTDLDLVSIDTASTNLSALTGSGALASVVFNTTLDGITVSGDVDGATGSTGGLVGQAAQGSVVQNCLSSAFVGVSANTNSSWVGGLIGQLNGSTLYRSGASGGVLFVSGIAAASYVGGLLGECKECTVTEAAATGQVASNGQFVRVGGLIGADPVSNGGPSTVSDVFATGDVSGGDTTYQVGGLGGFMRNTTFSRGYATGSVTGY